MNKGKFIAAFILLIAFVMEAAAAQRGYIVRKKLPEDISVEAPSIPGGGGSSSDPWAAFDVARVNAGNQGGISFTIHNAPVGGTYEYTFMDGDPATSDLWSAGVIVSGEERVGGIDVSSLRDGTLILDLVLVREGEDYDPINLSIVKDSSLPQLLSHSPADDSMEVGTQAGLIMNFGEEVLAGTGNIVLFNADGSVFEAIPADDGRVSFSGETVFVDPATNFVVGNSYYVGVPPTVILDGFGNGFVGVSGTDEWNFTVAVDAPNSCGLNPVAGTVCDDGTVYVGEPEVGDPVVFTTPCDAGMTWDAVAGACAGTQTGYPWNDGIQAVNVTNATSVEDGKFNTMKLMVTQPQPFMAAEYCAGLEAHGHDDWFLPAEAELDAMWQAMVAAGGVFGGSFAPEPYWSSTESDGSMARSQDFTDGAKAGDDKSVLKNVRCVRRNTAILEMVATMGNPDEMRIEGGVSPGASVTLAVTNIGVASSSPVVIELTNTDNFSKTEDECDGQTLAAGAACFITLAPVATESGIYTGVISARAEFGGVTRHTLILTAEGFSAKVPGTEEPDGTIYVGILPDGSEGYVPRCDSGMAWDTVLAACAGTRTNFKWGTWGKITGVANVDIGLFNTENLFVVDTGADAAKTCTNSTAYGHGDWYLPAKNELNLIYQASVADDGVLRAGFDFGGARYWSSTELGENSAYDAYYAQSQRWSDGVQESRQYKTDLLHVRCLRREGLRISVTSGDPATMNLNGYNDVGEDVELAVTNTASAATGAISVALAGDTVHFLKPADTCSGQVLSPGDTCFITLHPHAAADADYAGTLTISAYMGGTERISLAGAADNFLCVDSFVPGCRRDDGSIYAGVTTAGDEAYAARCDAGMAWDEATKKCTGTRLGLAWGAYTKTTGVTAADSGNLNTATLVAAYTDTAAARHCANLSDYGRDDWYLPAGNELDLVYATGIAVVGRFRANFNRTGERYWASTESGPYYEYYARAIKFSDGSVSSGSTKSDSLRVRCLRREGLKISVVSGNPAAMNLSGYNDLGEDVVLTVTNTATVASGAISVALAGDMLHFLKTADACSGQSLAAGGTCSITLHPYAAADADYAGTLAVAANPGGRDRISLAGSADNFLCADSFVPGCKAADTTIYAGNNAAGEEMYAVRCDAGMAWDDATRKCTGTRLGLAWGTYTRTTGVTNPDTGLANTARLATDYTDTAAAKHCANLSVHGHDDWYVPAKNELDVLYQGSVAAAGRFRVNFSLTGDRYWASTESGPYYEYYAARQRMSDGAKDTTTKDAGMRVRCLRREGIRISVTSGDPAAMDVVGGIATSDLVLSVVNNGRAPSGSLSVALTGNTANFLKTADSCSGQALAPSATCAMTIRPYAKGPGSYAALISVSGNPGGVDVIPLSGTASGFSFVCWGTNNFGHLGDGTFTDSLTPVAVVDMTSGVTGVSAGEGNTCAIMSGTAYCRGWNSYGRLGDGTFADSMTPVAVVGMDEDVSRIEAGNFSTCAIKSGALYCWGLATAQLGDGTITNSNIPVAVSGMSSGVTDVSVGRYFPTCAIKSGALYCWGENASGELGDGTNIDSMTPVAVVDMSSGVTDVAAGLHHACAVMNGALYCWGWDGDGKLGDGGSFINSNTPVAVQDMSSGVTEVAAGADHTCAIKSGALFCWGSNAVGQLGDGTTIGRAAPVAVVGMNENVTAVSAGDAHTCAIKSGSLYCWGANSLGQIGDGTGITQITPAGVVGLSSGVMTVSAGAQHSCALLE